MEQALMEIQRVLKRPHELRGQVSMLRIVKDQTQVVGFDRTQLRDSRAQR
jgi:hypothetical protein